MELNLIFNYFIKLNHDMIHLVRIHNAKIEDPVNINGYIVHGDRLQETGEFQKKKIEAKNTCCPGMSIAISFKLCTYFTFKEKNMRLDL